MPGTLLSLKEGERLTCFPDDIPNWDLITYFTLTEQDHTFIKSHRRDAHRLGVALQLCTMRYLGFCPTVLHEAPMETVSHLAAQLHVNPSELQDYRRYACPGSYAPRVADGIGAVGKGDPMLAPPCNVTTLWIAL